MTADEAVPYTARRVIAKVLDDTMGTLASAGSAWAHRMSDDIAAALTEADWLVVAASTEATA